MQYILASNIDFPFDDNSDNSDSTAQSDVDSSDNNDKDSNNFSISKEICLNNVYNYLILSRERLNDHTHTLEQSKVSGHGPWTIKVSYNYVVIYV